MYKIEIDSTKRKQLLPYANPNNDDEYLLLSERFYKFPNALLIGSTDNVKDSTTISPRKSCLQSARENVINFFSSKRHMLKTAFPQHGRFRCDILLQCDLINNCVDSNCVICEWQVCLVQIYRIIIM